MRLNYTFEIIDKNGTHTVSASSYTDVHKLDESLDNAVLFIPRSTRKQHFKRFSKVNVTIKNQALETLKNETWLIYATKVKIESKGVSRKYNHTLGLIEPTKWLEKFIIGTKTFTQPINGTQYTIDEVIDIIRELAPLVPYQKLSNTRLFTVDSTLKAKASLITSPQLYFDKKNMREILIDTFKVMNAIPRLRYDSGWVLDADYVNQKKLLFTIEDNIDYQSEMSGEDFGQAVEIYHENTLPEEPETNVFENSITDYISYRSDDIIVGESNRKLILSDFIAELKSISILIQTAAYEVTEFDMTDYCIEKKLYDSYNFKGGVGTKEYSCYWQYKQNYIDGLNETFNIFGTKMAIENIIDDIKSENGVSFSGYDCLFKVTYRPFIESMRSKQYRIDRQPYEITDDLFDEYSSLLINQSERINELYDLTENVYGQIQRLGVDTVSISKKHYDITAYSLSNTDGIYSMGDYTSDGYIVTKVEVDYYTTYAIARYELSKNWNRISQFIKINKEFRPYEIALTKSDFTLKRDLILPIAYVEVSNTDYHDDNDLNNNLIEHFMDTFKTTTKSLPYTVADIKTNDLPFFSSESITGVTKPLQLLAEKNVIKYRVNFNDTKLAGKSISEIVSSSKYQTGVYYTDEDGKFVYVKFYLRQSVWEQNIDSIPMGEFNTPLYNLTFIADNFPKLYLNKNDKRKVIVNKVIYDANELTLESELDVLTATNGEYYYFTDGIGSTYAPYVLYYFIGSAFLRIGYIVALLNDVDVTLPVYKVYKDTSEILGIDLAIPILIDITKINNFVIGDWLVKNNTLLKSKGITDRLIWQTRSTPFMQNETNNIGVSGTTENLDDISIGDNYISVPSTIYASDYYALTDSEGNLYVAVNQKNLDGTSTTITTIYYNVINEILTTSDKQLTWDSYFENVGALLTTYSIPMKIRQSEFSNTGTLETAYTLLAIYRWNVVFENEGVLQTNYIKGKYDWVTSDVTAYNAATTKSTVTRDTDVYSLPTVGDYEDALRVIIYNMQISSSIEYALAGTTYDLTAATSPIPGAETVEDLLAAQEATAFATFTAGNMTDTVIKVTDSNLIVTYWKPDYSYDYYIVDFVNS